MSVVMSFYLYRGTKITKFKIHQIKTYSNTAKLANLMPVKFCSYYDMAYLFFRMLPNVH